MGRAMLIICAGVLIALGFVSINTSNQGKSLTQKTVNYAEFTMAKNAAHTAIQIAMQRINKEEDWAEKYDPQSSSYTGPWTVDVQGLEIQLTTGYKPDADYWEPDSLWLQSQAQLGEIFDGNVVEVRSLYLMQPFSSLVPDFEGALSIAAHPDSYNFTSGGNATINGKSPNTQYCADGDEEKPPIKVSDSGGETFGGFNSDSDQLYEEDSSLNYEPTDELIERLSNTNGVTYINGTYGGDMGSPENPGVFFVEDENARITGTVREGWGILVIRTSGEMVIEEDDGTRLDLAGNFTFNGLVIFENADTFRGRGTPTINGSVLVGNPGFDPDYPSTKTEIDISGNIEVNYDCQGSNFAKMAAADAVKQNKYTRIVSTENIKIN